MKVGFIRTFRYVKWLPNIVPVIKNNGQVRVCIDYISLNLAPSKDEYGMPVADMLVNIVGNHGILTFIDGYSRYNHIYVPKSDTHKIAFRHL